MLNTLAPRRVTVRFQFLIRPMMLTDRISSLLVYVHITTVSRAICHRIASTIELELRMRRFP